MTTYCKNQAQADAEILEFLATSYGKSFPNQWGNQCVSYVTAMCTAVLGRPWTETLGYGNAIDLIDSASTTYFDKIWNDPKNPDLLPRVGWITCYTGATPLWDGRYYGHTGAVSAFTRSSQTQVQQDGAAAPTRRFPDGYSYSVKPAHKDTFAYVGDPRVGNIRGWLRFKWQKVVYTGADSRGYGTTSPTTAREVAKKVLPFEMDGIDVSNWQYSKRGKGNEIQLSKVAAGFVGVLATDGKSFVNPDMATALKQAQKAGRKLLVYHFARVSQSDSDTQARHFLKQARSWIAAGAVPVLDWEEDAWNHRADWAIDWIRYVERETGAQCAVYQRIPASQHGSWGSFRRPMWLSWFGTTSTMNGYATDFSGKPAVPGWHVAIWQYSEYGRLPGYSGDLDLNRYFGGIPAWDNATMTEDPDILERLLTMTQAEFNREAKIAGTAAWNLKNGRDHSWETRKELRGLVPTIFKTKHRRPDGSTVTLQDIIAYDRENWTTSRANEKKALEQNAQIIQQNAQIIELLTNLTERLTK